MGLVSLGTGAGVGAQSWDGGKGEVRASSPSFSPWRSCSPGSRSPFPSGRMGRSPVNSMLHRRWLHLVCAWQPPAWAPALSLQRSLSCLQGKVAGPHGSPWLAPGPGPLLGSCCAQGVFLESCEGPGNRTQDWQTKFQLGLAELQSSKSAVSLKQGPFLHGAILGKSRSFLPPAPWDLRGVSWGPKARAPRKSLCLTVT